MVDTDFLVLEPLSHQSTDWFSGSNTWINPTSDRRIMKNPIDLRSLKLMM